jgi:hypothetical protein
VLASAQGGSAADIGDRAAGATAAGAVGTDAVVTAGDAPGDTVTVEDPAAGEPDLDPPAQDGTGLDPADDDLDLTAPGQPGTDLAAAKKWKPSCKAAQCDGKRLPKTNCSKDPKKKILDNVAPARTSRNPSAMPHDVYLVYSPGCHAFWAHVDDFGDGVSGGSPACNGLAHPQTGTLVVEAKADIWRPYGRYTVNGQNSNCPDVEVYRDDSKLLRSGTGYRAHVCRTYGKASRCSTLSFEKP